VKLRPNPLRILLASRIADLANHSLYGPWGMKDDHRVAMTRRGGREVTAQKGRASASPIKITFAVVILVPRL